MTDPLQHVARPRDLDGATLSELAEGYKGHISALVAAEHGTGELERPARLQSDALDALAIGVQVTERRQASALDALDDGVQVAERMRTERWVTVRDALTYGATVAKVARALDMEPAAVAQAFSEWADGQREHELMTAEQYTRVLALLPGVVS